MTLTFFAGLLLAAAPVASPPPEDAALRARVERVLAVAPVIDGHNDLAWAIREKLDGTIPDLNADTRRLPRPLDTDLARAAAGHLGGQFWSVYIPADTPPERAVERTLEQIDIVRRVVAAYPDRMMFAITAAEVRAAIKAGKLASLMGVEGGHQIDGRLSMIRIYRALGVGYMTLTHTRSLGWADASTDAPRANGLTDFGRKVVVEMNRVGMLVDVSHVSDATMAAAIAASRAPVIASHSNARAISGVPRAIPDDLLRAIGAKGGVVMVNFFPAQLSADWSAWDKARTGFAASAGVPANLYGDRAPAPLAAWDKAHPMPRVGVAHVADHIEHVARLAGKASVGIGGDLDGVPFGAEGLGGVDGYPALFAELARRGWSDAELAALAQGNILRVMEAAEAVARASAAEAPIDARFD